MSIESSASPENETLVLSLLQWVAEQPRSYADVMEAWRTSCPRFPIWEDAIRLGLVARVRGDGPVAMVEVTAAGADFIRASQ